MPKKMTIAIALMLLVTAAPVAAHTESNSDACERNDSPCNPDAENHEKCRGVRDWFDKGSSGSLSMLGLHLAENPQEIGAYLHAPPHEDDSEAPQGPLGIVQMPGVLWLETNGFSSLQKSNWECISGEHGDPKDPWVEHPDQVIL